MRKIKVLLLLHELTLTGAPKIALDIFERLQDEVDVTTLTLQGGPLEPRCRSLGPLQLVPALPAGGALSKRWKRRSWRLRAERAQPDLIYINSVAALPLAEKLNLHLMPQIPVLIHIHELNMGLEQFCGPRLELFSRWPNRFLVVAEAVRQVVVDRYGIATAQTRLVHEFVRDEDFRAAATPTPKKAGGPVVIGGSGYPSWRKGPLLWLQMAVDLKNRLGEQNVRFVWVGIHKDKPSLEFREIARKLEVDHLIEFVPVTSEPYKYFSRFDVFAMTSWEDPCPLVVLESMMFGKPVVCFAGGGGAPEEVGDTGVVIPNFCPRSMAQAIAEIVQSPDRQAALGAAARRRVGEQFTASIQVPKVLEEMRSLVQSGVGSWAGRRQSMTAPPDPNGDLGQPSAVTQGRPRSPLEG